MPYDNAIEADLAARIVFLLTGPLEGGKHYWCYVAVKPSRFDAFKAAYMEKRLNLYDFEAFGEVVSSGEGTKPPADETRKAAEKYGIQPDEIFARFNAEAAVRKRIAEVKAKAKDVDWK